MSRLPGAASWNDLAASLARSQSGSRAEEGSTVSELEHSDLEKFPAPLVSKDKWLSHKRDKDHGWNQRGRDELGRGGVNVIKKDDTLINLAMQGKTSLEAQLKVAGRPIIGLDHIVEFIDPDDEAALRIYHCVICNVFRTSGTAMDHIVSYHHRVRTLRKHFPSEANMFLMPDRESMNRNPGLMSLCTKRAMEHELVYGRGEVVTKRERASYPEVDLDNEESDKVVILQTKQLEYLETTYREIQTLSALTLPNEYKVVQRIVDILNEKMVNFRELNPQHKL